MSQYLRKLLENVVSDDVLHSQEQKGECVLQNDQIPDRRMKKIEDHRWNHPYDHTSLAKELIELLWRKYGKSWLD